MRRAVAAVSEEEEDIGNDSEIVEVIKVRKHACEDTPPIKRSMTLRLRALNALKSFTKVGKSKTADDTLPTTSTPLEEPRPKAKTVSGRSRSSKAAKLTSKSSPSLHLSYSAGEQEQSVEDPPRTSSPVPSNTRRTALSKGFSRMFQKSSPAPSVPLPVEQPQAPAAAPARSSSGTSDDSAPPCTPPDESPSTSIAHEESEEPVVEPSVKGDNDEDPDRPSVDSALARPNFNLGELKLDSLHFDELSFDATRF